METEQNNRVQSVSRMMKIIETIRMKEGSRVSELAEELDTPKSTIYGYLRTLHDDGYLIKEGDAYQIGTKFLRLGEYSRTRKEAYELAQEKVKSLMEQTDERAQFVIEEKGKGVFMYRESGDRAVEAGSGTGKRMFLHSTSAGKAILAELPKKRVQEIIRQYGLPAVTANTITSEKELFEELSEIRNREYAFNMEENIEGLRAVGTAVKSSNDMVIGALSISGPTHRMKGKWLEKEVPDLLLGTANELELNIAYS